MIRVTRLGIDSLILTVFAGASVCLAISACSVSATEPQAQDPAGAGSGTLGSSGSSSTTAGAGTVPTAGSGTVISGAGTTGAAGSAGNGTAGAAGGSGAVVPLCTTKVTLQTPTIADFETYDGTTAPADYSWIFGGAAGGMLGVHTSTYAFSDGSAPPMLAILAGHGGNYGLTVSVTNATLWGEGFGMYLLDEQYKPGCINASAYKGVTMWVRGMVPTGTFSFSVSMSQALLPSSVATAPGGSCAGTDATSCKSPTVANLPVTATWTQVNVLWADLIDGMSGPSLPLAANGDNITGFSFGANLTFVPESEGSTTYVPVPGDISIVVDDLAFIP